VTCELSHSKKKETRFGFWLEPNGTNQGYFWLFKIKEGSKHKNKIKKIRGEKKIIFGGQILKKILKLLEGYSSPQHACWSAPIYIYIYPLFLERLRIMNK
jgi:hypothetical protein